MMPSLTIIARYTSLLVVVQLTRLLLTGALMQIEFTNMTSKYLPEHYEEIDILENEGKDE